MNTGVAARGAAVILSLVAMAAANVARADQGMVIWRNYECGYFVMQLKSGYALFELVSGPMPNNGDLLEGDIQSPGEYRLHNKTADLPSGMYLEEISQNRAAIASRIPLKCKLREGYVPFEGQ